MASAHPLPPSISAPPRPPEAAAVDASVEQALVPTFHTPGGAIIKLTEPVAQLPVELEVAVPVRDFRVRNLLSLELGQVIETQWSHGADMPLACGDVQLAWSEFEVVDTQLAVRVTRLA
jgi:flagellar motor switch protein FliN/FliY